MTGGWGFLDHLLLTTAAVINLWLLIHHKRNGKHK